MKKTNFLFNTNNKYIEHQKDNKKKDIIISKFLIVSLTSPKPKKNDTSIFSSIASVFHMDQFKISDEFLTRLALFNIPKFILFIITREENANAEKVWIRNYFLDEKNSNKLFYIYIRDSDFFTLDLFNFVFQDYKKLDFLKKSQICFMFQNISWKEVVAKFRVHNIEVSGGSNTKKHMFSPNHLKLSLFLWCFLGFDVYDSIVDSFNKKEKLSKGFNFETKSIRNFYKEDHKKTNPSLYKDTKDLVNIIKKELEDKNDSKEEKKNNLILVKNSNNNNINDNKTNSRSFHTSIKIKNNKRLIEAPNPLNNGEVIPFNSSGDNQLSTLKKQIENSKLLNYLDSVKNLIEFSLDKKETQLKLETSWIKIIEQNLQSEKGDEYLTQKYRGIIFSRLIEAKKTLDVWSDNKYLDKKFPVFKGELNKMEYVILTFAISLAYYNKWKYNFIAVKIGNGILYQKFQNLNKVTGVENVNFIKFKKDLNMDLKNVAKLGDLFLSLIMIFPHNIFERNINTESYWNKEVASLDLNREYINEIQNNIIITPVSLPMISPPKFWGDKSFGGYLTNSAKREDIITGSEYHGHTVENKKNLYTAINTLNKIKFSINTKFLDYINNEGKYLLDENKAEDYLQRITTLKVAEVYRNTPFYLTTNADWRGRIYCQSFFLTYQGGDLTTALLNFWKGEPVNESQKLFLYIYGVNNHNINNISKASINERIKWVNDNYEKIIQLDRELILQAENPFIFTAFCLNMRDLHNNPKTKIYSPVFLDATCSGIQHLAALLKDVDLGSNVNLKESTAKDNPEDLYSSMVDLINFEINKVGKNNIEYAHFSYIKFDRTIVKPNIMTKVYNVTHFGMANQLKSKLEKVKIIKKSKGTIVNVDNNNTNMLYKDLKSFLKPVVFEMYVAPTKDGKGVKVSSMDLFKIAKIIDEKIFTTFPSLNLIYNYFISITKLMNRLELPISWVTPSGLEISQNYFKSKKTTIGISLFNKNKKMIFREWLNILDKNKQAQAIIPNVIHSLDASHLINLINQAKKDKFGPIITIHDCFGTLPSKMEELDYRVKKEFVLLYSQQNFLQTFHDRIIQTIKDSKNVLAHNKIVGYSVWIGDEIVQIPSVPKLGELDLEKIINAKYMIT